MARPSKCRKICSEPVYDSFRPEGFPSDGTICLTLDEFEAIRLIDLEHFTHEKCAKQMEISRTTVTEIYESARYKIADSLIHGKTLLISGGHYRLCQGDTSSHCFTRCTSAYDSVATSIIEKKENGTMRIAATYENGMIFQHFGQWDGMTLMRTGIDILMNRLHIRYWSVWRMPDICEKEIRCLIMDAVKGVWIFFCLIRRDVHLSELNMMNGYMKRQRRIIR